MQAEPKGCHWLLCQMQFLRYWTQGSIFGRLVKRWILLTCACVCAKLLQSPLTLCDPVNCSLPGSSVHGTLQARILEWVAVLSSWGSSRPRDRNCVSCIAGGFFINWAIPISSSSQGLFKLRGKGCPFQVRLVFSVRTPSRDAAEMSRGGLGPREWLHVHCYISRLLGLGSRWLKSRLANQTKGKRILCLQLQTKFLPEIIMKHTQCVFFARVWRDDSQAVYTLAQWVSVEPSWGFFFLYSPGSMLSFCCKYGWCLGGPCQKIPLDST